MTYGFPSFTSHRKEKGKAREPTPSAWRYFFKLLVIRELLRETHSPTIHGKVTRGGLPLKPLRSGKGKDLAGALLFFRCGFTAGRRRRLGRHSLDKGSRQLHGQVHFRAVQCDLDVADDGREFRRRCVFVVPAAVHGHHSLHHVREGEDAGGRGRVLTYGAGIQES